MNLGFENFNLGDITVTHAMVDECEKDIILKLKTEDFIDIKDEFNKINHITIQYNNSDSKAKQFKDLTEKISHFMAYQEAAYNLMIKGEIIPVTIKNQFSYADKQLSVTYIERSGNMTTTSPRGHYIPLFVHDIFIRTPSKKNQR